MKPIIIQTCVFFENKQKSSSNPDFLFSKTMYKAILNILESRGGLAI
jgi:hypothetical protein